jgi:hypothetical protein
LRKPGPPRAFGKRAPGRLSPRLVVGRLVMAAVGVFLLVGGFLTESIPTVIVGAVLVVVEAGVLTFQALAFRPSRWPGEPDELLTQVADAALARLDPLWHYELGTSDGFGATGLRVATFSRDSQAGPTLWFENSTTFRVTYVLPEGDEVSAEAWRVSAADHETLVEVLVALCEGRLTIDRHFASVETAKRPVKLPIFPVS